MSATKVIITTIAAFTAISSLTLATGVAGFAALVMLGNRQYGIRLEYKNVEVYYTSQVTEAEAKQFIEYLESVHSGEKHRITFQLDRSGQDFLVRMCAQEFVYTSQRADNQIQAMRDAIQEKYFPQENVVFEACDDKLVTRKTWRAKQSPPAR